MFVRNSRKFRGKLVVPALGRGQVHVNLPDAQTLGLSCGQKLADPFEDLPSQFHNVAGPFRYPHEFIRRNETQFRILQPGQGFRSGNPMFFHGINRLQIHFDAAVFQRFGQRHLHRFPTVQVGYDIFGEHLVPLFILHIGLAEGELHQVVDLFHFFREDLIRQHHGGHGKGNLRAFAFPRMGKARVQLVDNLFPVIFKFTLLQHEELAVSVIKHIIITEGFNHPAANEADGAFNLLIAVQHLGRSIIIRRHRDAVERRPFTPELPTDFIKGVLVEKMGLPVPVQIRVLGGQINHQNGQYTEIAGDQRIDKLLAEQDTGNQHRVVAQHAHFQAEVRLLPAQEDAQQGHGDVKIGTEVNNRIQMAVIVSFIRGKVENRSRPGGGKDEKHRNCRRDIG